MLGLRQTLALCCWCFLALHGRAAVADEEAPWGPDWFWTPTLPKLPSLPSLPFRIPFYGGNDQAAESTTISEGLPDTWDQDSGSGEARDTETSHTATPPTRGLPVSLTEIRSESLPTGTSDSPHSSSRTHSHNDTVVSDSYSPTGSSSTSPVFTNSRQQNATHTRPPQGAAVPHLPEEHADKEAAEGSTGERSSTIAPETTVPTTLTWATARTTTTNPGLAEAALRPVPSSSSSASSSQTTFAKQPQDTSVSVTLHAAEATVPVTPPPQSGADPGLPEERPGVITTAKGINHQPIPESITSTTQSQRVNFPIAGELPGGREDKEDEEGAVPSGGDGDDRGLADNSTPSLNQPATSQPQSTETPHIPLYTEDWTFEPVDDDVTFLPDCNKERSGICNLSETWDYSSTTTTATAAPTTTTTTTTPTASTTWEARPTQNTTASNQSISPFLVPIPPMLVPLYTDWNSAMAAWGLAWEAHVYGAGCVFAMLTLASALNLLCLPLRCPSGCGYFALVSLFLLAAGGTRSFALLYDAYGHQDRLPFTEASLMLYEAPFPCLTAAFGLVFLLLSMRSRMQLSYSAFQRPCFLACLVVLHFAAAFGPVAWLKFYQQRPPLCVFLSLVSRGAFVVLATFLSAAYFVFYIYVRADSKHIYHLNNTSPTPAERYNRCPFAESRDWDRAAVTVCVSALFSLACAGLQLYAMLNALGVAGGEEVFHPWPWWAFQFSCRLCELGVCLTLALVVAQPVYCSDHLPAAGSCWTELLASKSPILPGSYQWSLSQQEKLTIVDTAGLGETESLPLYTLMDERLGSSLNGLDLLYHSNRALAYRDLDLQGSGKPEDGGGREPSGSSSFTSDSTADLRPPSPINLRRSIDEALFSEALFPMSLFSPSIPIRLSDLSTKRHSTLPGNSSLCDPLSADPGLYRTSSCVEVACQPQPTAIQSHGGGAVAGAPPTPSLSSSSSSSCSSPERWRGSSSACSFYRASLGGSSLVLCPSPERHALQLLHRAEPQGHQGHANPQRHYHTLGAASQESLDLDLSSEADRSVQDEFVSVCRQIDTLSICSETIDL